MLAAIAQVRADGETVLEVGAVVSPEYLEGRAPFQDQLQWRALVFDFLSSYASMVIEWSDRAQATVAAWPHQSESQRERAALERIPLVLSRYPASATSALTSDGG